MDEFARYAEKCPLPVWLATPEMVAEETLDRTVAATMEAADCFEGVLVADLGLGMSLREKCRLGFKGTILNRESARRVIDLLGTRHLRLHPPTLETIEALAGVSELEITVHGKLPLSSTPRCPVAGFRDCNECEKEHIIIGGPKPLMLRGNAVYACEPISAFGLVEWFKQIEVEWSVIEALHLNAGEIERLAGIYRGKTPPTDRKSSGIFFGSDKSYLISRRWMDLIDLDIDSRYVNLKSRGKKAEV
ncbi:MAG: hypothetical protein ABIH66_13855 [bacterium]